MARPTLLLCYGLWIYKKETKIFSYSFCHCCPGLFFAPFYRRPGIRRCFGGQVTVSAICAVGYEIFLGWHTGFVRVPFCPDSDNSFWACLLFVFVSAWHIA
jgi:hypothetical protein